MIVECPSCLTKFSIDSQQLADIEDPRFNCCRCGSYFELQQPQADAVEEAETENTLHAQEIEPEEDTATQSGEWLVDETLLVTEKETSEAATEFTPLETKVDNEWLPDPDAELEDLFAPKNSGEQLPLLDTESFSGDEDPKPELSTKEDWSLGLEPIDEEALAQDLVTAEWPDVSPQKHSPEPALKGTSFSNNPKLNKTTVKPTVLDNKKKTKIAELLAQAKARSDDELEEQLSRVHIPETKTTSAKLNEDKTTDKEIDKDKRKARKRAKKQQKLIRDITFREKRALGKIPPINIRQQAPISCIACVPVFLLLLVTFFASNLEQLPILVQRALQVDTDSLPRLPPPGLGIVDLSSSVITLDSGHRALEIRGELLNATAEHFQEIKLLASLFNSANEKIHSLVINPENELKGAQVVALDADAIERLQNRVMERKNEVIPNQRLPFRIVFPSYKGTEKWFSTSVYSVEREVTEI